MGVGMRVEVRLGHRLLLEGLTSGLGVPKGKVEGVLSQLHTALPFSPAVQMEERASRWPGIAKALEDPSMGGWGLEVWGFMGLWVYGFRVRGAGCMWGVRGVWGMRGCGRGGAFICWQPAC